MPVKIAWIVPGFSSDERDWCIPALLNLARVMAARHELHVFALRYPYRRDRYPVFGAQVHAIGGAHRGRWTLPGIWLSAMREVTREHERAPFDVLHAFWLYEPGVIATWLKPRLDTRVIVSLAGGELIDLSEIAYGLRGRRALVPLMRGAMRRANVVTAGSNTLLDWARTFARRAAQPPDGTRRGAPPARSTGHDEARFVLAPLGVDVEMFSPASRRPQTPPTVVNTGSLQPVKGQADLIRAFRFVADRKPGVRLAIAGAGALKAELEALTAELNVADSVQFLGDVRHERLADVYREATLFVQASRHEAQGMAVLEAAACGLPIAGTAVGVLADLTPDAAVASPPGDPIRLAQVILSVLDDPQRLRALGEAARARVLKEYSLEAAAGRFEALYRS